MFYLPFEQISWQALLIEPPTFIHNRAHLHRVFVREKCSFDDPSNQELPGVRIDQYLPRNCIYIHCIFEVWHKQNMKRMHDT